MQSLLCDRRILFYVPGMDVINDGVYYSQVFALARYAVTLGARCLIAYTSEKDIEPETFDLEGVKLIRCKWNVKYTPLPFLPRKYHRSTAEALSKMRNFAPTHIYIRDPFSGLAGLKVAQKIGCKIVFSRRGAGVEKSQRCLKEWLKEILSCYLVWRIFRKASHVNVVSNRLLEMERRWFKGNMSVLQCCVMSERQRVLTREEREDSRKELAIAPATKVVAYSGGMSTYQCIDEILGLMKKLRDADNSIEFLFLTRGQEELAAKIRKNGLPSTCVHAKSCSPLEVTKYLQVADAAIILRQDETVNNVASPVKIAEYLASGLGVIVSPWIGDVKQILGGSSCALFYDRNTTIQSVLKFIYGMSDEKRSDARRIVDDCYTYEGNRDVVLSMFN